MYCVPAYQVRAGATPCSPAACNALTPHEDPKIGGHVLPGLDDWTKTSFYSALQDNALVCKEHPGDGKSYCFAPAKPGVMEKYWGFEDSQGSGVGTLYGFHENDTLPSGPHVPAIYANPCDGVNYWSTMVNDRQSVCPSTSRVSSSPTPMLGVGDFLMPAGDELY